ncbi:MAG: hypothetical protein ACI8WY_000754 [Planctomycetota bacterium]|jgi:hypothetical protein
MLIHLPLALASLSTVSTPSSARTEEPEAFVVASRVEVSRKGETLALRDLTGDGRLELIQINASGLEVRASSATGVYPAHGVLFPWSTATVGWDLVDLDGNGSTELLLVTDGQHLVQHTFANGEWAAGIELVTTEIYLPSGLSRIPFGRDVDGDERLDLVLPGPGRFHIMLNRTGDRDADHDAEDDAGGTLSWSDPLIVEYDPNVNYDFGDPMRLSSTFGQSVRVPFFQVEDVDGDGRQDLISEVGDRVSVHLARPEIDATPTWELDLSGYRGTPSLRELDLDDLLSSVSGLAQWRLVDMDGVAPRDLVVGGAGEVRVFLGGAATGPSETPSQVLKSSGNVLRYFVRDVVGDERPDLQVVRGERLSLARLLKYLLLPGQLEFDVLTYQNEDGLLARRPTQRATIGLRVPRLITFFGEAKELGDRIEEQWKMPARRLAWDADGQADDVMDEVDGQLVIYRNVAPAEHRFEHLSMERGIEGLVEQVIIQDTDRLGDGGLSVIDIGTLDEFVASPASALREAVAGVEPVARMPLWQGRKDRQLSALDLNADGKIDVVSVIEGEGTYRVELLVQR